MTSRAAPLLAALLSCAAPPAPEVLVGGCALISPEGTCLTESGALTVWTPHGGLAVGGTTPTGTAVHGGVRYDLRLEQGDTITVEGRGVLSVQLGLGAIADCDAGPVGRAWCDRQDARQRMADGSVDEAAALFDRAAGLFAAAGWAREAAINRDRAAFQRAQARGTTVQEGADWPADHDAHAWLMGARVRELGLRQAGRLRELRRLQRAIVDLEARTGAPAALDEARLLETRTALALGDVAPALASLREVLTANAGPGCDALDRAAHVGWQTGQLWWSRTLIASEDDAAGLRAQVLPRLTDAAIDACPGRGRPADRRVDRALLQLAAGDVTGATASLDAAATLDMRDETRLWWHLLRGELALAAGQDTQPDAEAAEVIARAAGLREGIWMARDLRAAGAAARGDLPAALQAWDDAAHELSALAAFAPLLGGRSAFLDLRAVAAGRHVDALLAAGRLEEAMQAGRAWRRSVAVGTWAHERFGADTADLHLADRLVEIEAARAARSELEGELRTTPASERARVAQELARAQKAEGELIDTALEPLEGDLPVERPRERGEALLLVVPTGGRGERLWRGIWQDDEGVVAGAPLSEAALRAAPAQLLPGERALRPRVVSLLLPAALEDLDLHLVPVGDRPWALQVPVRWSLDLGRAPQPADSHTALVVGDPEGGLAGARAEASEAADQLRSAGWSVQTLGRGADRAALAAALRTSPPAWLHVAAHGEAEGWEPRIKLADGTSWTVRDALLMAQPPRQVLLSGCQSARSRATTTAGLGLAHAFVHGGADAAFAAVTDVGDDAAARFAADLLAAHPWEVGPELGLQRALRRAAEAGELAAVAGYRVITP